MRIDSHQHFWRCRPEEYAWIGPGMEALKRDYLPEGLRPLLQSAGVDGTVAVQARQTLGETAWLLQLAGEHRFIRGVVGWVDLCGPAAREQLERFAADPRLCGVRHVLHDEPDDGFMLRPEFLRGLALLAGFGLTYDLLIFPRHLPAACELVCRFPEQRFVVDHIAKPPIREGIVEPWASDIRRLAAFPNVTCKLSGLVTEAAWHGWQPADFRPYLAVVLEAFGPQRLMIGSDWPVCTLAGAYGEVMQIVSDYVGSLSQAEQTLVLGDTARRVYKLA